MTTGTIYVKKNDEWRAIYCWSDFFEDEINPRIERLKKENKLFDFWNSMKQMIEDEIEEGDNNWIEQFENFFNGGEFKYDSNLCDFSNEGVKSSFNEESKEDQQYLIEIK